MKRKQIFDVGFQPYCSVSGSEGDSAQQYKKIAQEQRGRELMNEGSCKNRKPKGEGKHAERKEVVCLSLEELDWL